MNNSPHNALCIGYKEKYIEETVKKKFLGLHIDNHLNWKNHIDQMIPKLSGACYTVRLMFHISNITTLKISLFHILSFYYKVWNNFLGVILPTAGKYFPYKRTSSELWLVHDLELQVEVYLKN
jgi:hypothetical protein